MALISHRSERSCACGFTYIGLLIVVALAGIALAGAGTLWTTSTKRDREAELLFVGEQFQRAISAYYDLGPGGVRQFPAKLEDLLQDRRFPTNRRHLRKVFVDPITGTRDWGLVRGPGGGITGVFSNSEAVPLKRAEFAPAFAQFAAAKTYRDWKFVHRQNEASPGGATKPTAPGAAGATGQPIRTERAVPAEPAR
jgi:type II secretory pathway pseudopilin PulG